MDFRRMQARLEEIRLEGLYAELRAIESRDSAVALEGEMSEKALKAAPSVTGFDLELFGSYRSSLREERTRIEKIRAECRQRIDAQLRVLAARRREVRLLEKLEEQRLEKWEQEILKEIDQQAEEAYLAKWDPR